METGTERYECPECGFNVHEDDEVCPICCTSNIDESEFYAPDPDDLHAVVNYDEDMYVDKVLSHREHTQRLAELFMATHHPDVDAVERFLNPTKAEDYTMTPPITVGQRALSAMLWLLAGGCWVIAVVAICLAAATMAQACEQGGWELRLDAGKQGQWLKPETGEWNGEDGIAAIIGVSYIHPITSNLYAAADLHHHSHWDKGFPMNNDEEDELDSLTIGLRWRL
jgi:hypothetical protein